MVTSHAFDALDRRLLHALQLDGRASFSRIGEVLGVSGQTVARHYTALRSHGMIKVIGLSDPDLLGEVLWLTRVRCTPDAAGAVAGAIARRDDTAWVHLTSGGTEIVCVTRVPGGNSDENTPLLQQLPHTPRVLDVTAQCVLNVFLGGGEGLLRKARVLTAAEVEALSWTTDATPRHEMSEQDCAMLALLRTDGRTQIAELAAATGWSQTTVRRRLAELRAGGLLRFVVDFDHRLLGYGVHVLLWLSVEPADLEMAGTLMAEEHPEVAYVAATTGRTNLVAGVVCTSVKDLYGYLTRRLAVLPGVRQIETAPVVRTLKSATVLNPGRPGATGW
ncbi:Lrp/AsnC family transcriptional regulator [Amycolatopsis albispora]|uniref:Lrp/AsnC family transcriptional regulator n=1 Tax=Amycolatopsis albispora TaxID=1804986 RepID=UPI001962EFEE|nr:AsnC family transcriptional regulator [Amycolatopsis albispora]